jgi:hypothetical protein
VRSENKENWLFIGCLVIQSVPFFLSNYQELTLNRYYYPHYRETLILLLFCIPLLNLIELFAILFVIEGTKRWIYDAKAGYEILTAKVLLALVIVFITVYQLLIATSWYYYSQTGIFLGRDTVRLYPKLLDYQEIINTFSPSKWLQIATLLILSVLLSCWIVYFAPKRSFSNFLRRHGRGFVLCLLLVLVIILPQASF